MSEICIYIFGNNVYLHQTYHSLTLKEMKKSFLTILAIVAMVGAVCSCKKDKPTPTPGPDTPDETTLITIDGDFADWTKAANVVTAELDEEATSYLNLLTMKAVADEENIYLYFEYEIAEDQTVAPIDILVNSDNNSATGFSSWIWTNVGWEYMLESEAGFLAGSSVQSMDDLAVYKCNGPDGVDAWDAESNGMTKLELTSFAENAGKVESGIAYFEMSILRSAVNATKKGALTLGVTMTNVVDGDWVTTGILPTFGSEDMLEVALP